MKKIKFDDFVCSIGGVITLLWTILMVFIAKDIAKEIDNPWFKSALVIGFPLFCYAVTAFSAIYTHNKKVDEQNSNPPKVRKE